MSVYRMRYFGRFKDYYDRYIFVEIWKRDHDGVAIDELIFDADPLTKSYPGDDNDILKGIFGSEMKINIVSMENFQYLELFASDSKEFQLKVYTPASGGLAEVTWQGWLLPDLFNEPYVAPPYTVSLSARCGIAELKEIKIPAKLRNSLSYNTIEEETDFIEPFFIIYRGLQQCSAITEIWESVNILPFDDTDPVRSPLLSTKLYLASFAGMTWYDVIADILEAFHSRLYLEGGAWRIARIWERESVVRKFSIVDTGSRTTVSVNVDTVLPATKQIGRPVARNHIADAATLDVLPAVKAYTIVNKYPLISNFIRNGNFTEVRSPITRRIFLTPTITDTEVIYPVSSAWNIIDAQNQFYGTNPKINPDDPNSADAQPYMYLISRVIGGETVLFVENKFLGFDAPEGNRYITRIYQGITNLNNTESSDYIQRFRITLKAAMITTIQEDDNFSIRIKYSGLDSTNTLKTYYLEQSQDQNFNFWYEWTDVDRTIKYTLTKVIGNNSNFLEVGFEDIEIVTAPLTLSQATIEVMFINSHVENNKSDATMVLSTVRGWLVETDSAGKEYRRIDEYTEENPLNFTVNSKNINVLEEKILRTGDLPDVPNAKLIWSGGLRLPNTNPTKLWRIKGETTELPLATLNGVFFAQSKFIPQFKLSLSILANDMDFNGRIVDYQVLPKEYLCNTFDFSYRDCISDGTYIEVGAWDGADWILEQGSWDEDGIWIEDETWNDV